MRPILSLRKMRFLESKIWSCLMLVFPQTKVSLSTLDSASWTSALEDSELHKDRLDSEPVTTPGRTASEILCPGSYF